MDLSVSGFECLLMRVFVCMYTQVYARVSAYTRVCRHALWSARNQQETQFSKIASTIKKIYIYF